MSSTWYLISVIPTTDIYPMDAKWTKLRIVRVTSSSNGNQRCGTQTPKSWDPVSSYPNLKTDIDTHYTACKTLLTKTQYILFYTRDTLNFMCIIYRSNPTNLIFTVLQLNLNKDYNIYTYMYIYKFCRRLRVKFVYITYICITISLSGWFV